MAREFQRVIACGFAVTVCAGILRAEPAEKPAKKQWLGKRPAATAASPEFENVRKALDALTPEQRKRFQENFARWSNLPPDEKAALRNREDLRRRRMLEEVESAIQETGLDLDKDRRAQFTKRYAEERRKVEEQLRRETEEKRRPLVKDIVARLKTEFATAPAASVTPPAGTP